MLRRHIFKRHIVLIECIVEEWTRLSTLLGATIPLIHHLLDVFDLSSVNSVLHFAHLLIFKQGDLRL